MRTVAFVNCPAPFREAVGTRLAARQFELATGGDSDVLAIYCASESAWAVLAEQAQSERSPVTVAIIDRLDLDQYAQALAMGAAGVVYADTSAEIIAEAIDAATRGEVLLPRYAAQAIARRAVRDAPVATLDAAELDLLRALAEGETAVSLAERLAYSERTVRRYLQNVYLKLGVANRSSAIHVATAQGLLD